MSRQSAKIEKLICYGVSDELARKAVAAKLSVTSIRSTSQQSLVDVYGLQKNEAKALCEAVKREPIDEDVAHMLLRRSNFLCNVCKGAKSHAVIIHHIDEYHDTQDNNYNNLIVLCPSDHDLAHRGGLSLSLSRDDLFQSKSNWEKQVEVANAQRAAQSIDINEEAIDYVNVNRIEELCFSLFNEIPATRHTARLQNYGILDKSGARIKGTEAIKTAENNGVRAP